MIYIYCPRKSNGARDLVKKLRELGTPAVRGDIPHNPDEGELTLNWGAVWHPSETAGVLNAKLVHNKFKELQALAMKGVPVPQHGLARQQGWLARKLHHHEANDLLAHLTTGDYYVEFVPVVKEFRCHVWRGRCIRSGMKVHRTPFPHPNFRSWRAGWKLSYGLDCQEYITDGIRKAARRAVEALGYDFGAVDVGLKPDGSPVVFEVNAAPGLEGNTIVAYANAIIKTLQEG